MSTSRRAWVCARECTRVSVGAWEPRGPPPSPSLPWECRRRRGNAEGRPCALRRRQGRAWGAGVCPLPTPRSAQGGRRVHPQTHQPAAAVTPGRPSCLRGGDTVSPLTAGSGQGWAVRPFPGTLGQAASEAPGAGPGSCFLLLVPCGRRSGTVRQGLGGQLGPLLVSLSRGLLLVFILLAVPTCLAHRLSDSVFTAEETLQVPASASPRDPAGCHGPGWTQRERLAYPPPPTRPVPVTFSGLPLGPIACLASTLASSVGGWRPHPHFPDGESKAPEVKWPVQGHSWVPGACLRGRALAPACTKQGWPNGVLSLPHGHCSLLK